MNDQTKINDIYAFIAEAASKAEDWRIIPEERRQLADIVDRIVRLDSALIPDDQREIVKAQIADIMTVRDRLRTSPRVPGGSFKAMP